MNFTLYLTYFFHGFGGLNVLVKKTNKLQHELLNIMQFELLHNRLDCFQRSHFRENRVIEQVVDRSALHCFNFTGTLRTAIDVTSNKIHPWYKLRIIAF